jgi:uncharacterized protein YrrD
VTEPVSWFLIERGWKVVGVDGEDIGRVEEVVGDTSSDIFNGLAVSTGLLAKPRYVPAEQVGEITDGEVQLKLPAEHVERLGEHEPPAPA